MSELKEQRITELQNQHDLPTGILAQCVDESGTVDTARLSIALSTQAFTKTGMIAQNEGLIAALNEQYYLCQDKRDASGMLRCKDRIVALGGRLGPRKTA
jgi:hypothetical protein